MNKPETFRQFFERTRGPYPGIVGEDINVVQARVFDATADWMDELARRNIEMLSKGYVPL